MSAAHVDIDRPLIIDSFIFNDQISLWPGRHKYRKYWVGIENEKGKSLQILIISFHSDFSCSQIHSQIKSENYEMRFSPAYDDELFIY